MYLNRVLIEYITRRQMSFEMNLYKFIDLYITVYPYILYIFDLVCRNVLKLIILCVCASAYKSQILSFKNE